MTPVSSPMLALVPKVAKRGRPLGAVKENWLRLSDYVRTVALMQEVFARTACAGNANQFARWFDETMRKRHPQVAWETERSGKWRKNALGIVSLNPESIDHLQELFPDGRYYAAVATRAKGRVVEPAYGAYSGAASADADSTECLDARRFYDDGPARLWRALWDGESDLFPSSSDPEQLWSIYPATGEFEGAWGVDCPFDAVVGNLHTKLFGDLHCGIGIESEDLGRAVVVYRQQNAGRCGSVEDGMTAYLCVRLALADCSQWLRALNVFDEISTYIVRIELDRLRLDERYRQVLEARCQSDATWGLSGILWARRVRKDLHAPEREALAEQNSKLIHG